MEPIDEMDEFDPPTENIFTTVERTNTSLVESNLEHLDVIIEALTFAIGSNLRLMDEEEPTAIRENSDAFMARFEEFMDGVIEDVEENWQQITLQ